mmetsp:Transcript_10830/g.23296  ORF Transcript_10830/g.23296 Transcript_10830/m.23296 type:complete len:102 (+) Transcript_10830:211-516(+)
MGFAPEVVHDDADDAQRLAMHCSALQPTPAPPSWVVDLAPWGADKKIHIITVHHEDCNIMRNAPMLGEQEANNMHLQKTTHTRAEATQARRGSQLRVCWER